MFNLGFGELLVIALVFIIVVGPDRLPELLRMLGKALRTIQKANYDLRSSIGIDKLSRELLYPPNLPGAVGSKPKPASAAEKEPPTTEARPASSSEGDTAGVTSAPVPAEDSDKGEGGAPS